LRGGLTAALQARAACGKWLSGLRRSQRKASDELGLVVIVAN